MKIAMAQMRMSDNVQDNLAKSIEQIRLAKQQGADLVLFPEVQLTPFFPQYSGIDEDPYLLEPAGQELQALQAACKEYGIAASPNFFIDDDGDHYDASFMIDAKGELLGISKMVHIATFPYFYEAEYYHPSDDGFKVYDVEIDGKICKIGIVICFDRHLPESIRVCALKGADLVLVPTANMTNEPMEKFNWEMRIQAMHNGVNIAMCNRVGPEGEIAFSGQSIVIDPDGEIIHLSGSEECLDVVEVDLDAAKLKRETSPYLTSRRPDEYHQITKK